MRSIDSARRAAIAKVAALGLANMLPRSAIAQASTNNRLPNPQTFQSGDLVWPKKPGAIVPYNSGVETNEIDERAQWEREKQAFLGQVPAHSRHLSAAQLERLRAMKFEEFHSRYAGDREPETAVPYGSGGLIYVGHVAVVEIDGSGTPWVIEAIYGKGVLRKTYQAWLDGRPDQIVWHGRLRELPAGGGAAIAAEAKKHLGRPYDFWNFDLNNDEGFYCSKLVWLSAWRALALAVDGDSDARRAFWFSPKQLLYVDRVARLNDPGQYANV